MNEIERIISNCPLCEEHSLHVIGNDTEKMQQCIACGYVNSSKFKGTRDDNEEYNNLTDDMKGWSKEALGGIWIPSIFTLPDSLIYPDNVNGEMKWKLAEMVDIPEEEQKNFPIEGGGFYERMYDVDNSKVYDNFYEVMHEVNTKSKIKETKKSLTDIELPKIKK